MPTALITGGHGGIGYECAKQLATGPRFNLILAGRDLTRVEPAAQRLRTEYNVQVTALQMDTSSLASVREAAARCRAMIDRGEVDALQAILCNAGARIEALNYTLDGYEETFATNHLGHFLLIELLIDRWATTAVWSLQPAAPTTQRQWTESSSALLSRQTPLRWRTMAKTAENRPRPEKDIPHRSYAISFMPMSWLDA